MKAFWHRPAAIAGLIGSLCSAAAVPVMAQQPEPAAPPAAPSDEIPNCPDPAAVQFDLTGVNVRTSGGQRTYSFRLVGVVANIGSVGYHAPGNQASATIHRIIGGLLSPQFGIVQFPSTEPGTTWLATSTPVSNWTKGNPAAPSFRFKLNYTRDLTGDGNPNNDDCVLTNNELTLTAAEVDALLPP